MPIQIALSRAKPLSFAADLVAVGIVEGAKRSPIVRELGDAIGSSVQKSIKRAEFTGKPGQTCEIASGGSVRAARVLLVGLGSASKVQYSDIRRFAALAARRAAQSRCESLGIALPELDLDGIARAAAEGAVLGGYRYERFKTNDSRAKFPLERVSLLVSDKITDTLRRDATLGD